MELYRRYGPALLRKAERMLQDRDEAQDLVQGLFLDLIRRPRAAADLPYLYRAITNRCLNHLRDRGNRGRLLSQHDQALQGVPGTRVDEIVLDRQLLGSLARCLDALAWEILVYHFIDDMTQDEIAVLLGTSRKTIGRRLKRVRDEASRLAGTVPGAGPKDVS
jgi:RNA polymerase sigma-70 factor, ECF subfamily